MKSIKKTAISMIMFAVMGMTTVHAASPAPKYVFVFVGDGMSYPQIQSAAYYTGNSP